MGSKDLGVHGLAAAVRVRALRESDSARSVLSCLAGDGRQSSGIQRTQRSLLMSN